jgi:autotransporter translocation and assembly factor TamB
MKAAVNLTLRFVHPVREADLSVSGARGGFLSGMEVYGVRLRRNDGSLEVTADTLAMRYRLDELIGGSPRLRGAVLAGVHVAARWPLRKSVAEEPPEASHTDFTVDRIELRRGSARLQVRAVQRDSVLEVEHLGLAISELRITRTPSLTLDTLTATLRAPSEPAGTVRVAAAGKLSHGRVEVRMLTVDGDRTRVAGAGILPLPSREGWTFEGANFRLTCAPLAGSDIRRFLPVVGDPGDVTLDLTARGDSSTLHVALDARAVRGGHVNLEAGLPARAGAVALRTSGRIQSLDLGAILGGDPDRLAITAQWTADLAGPDLRSISGPLTLDLAGTRARAVRLDEARLSGRFEDGRVTLQLAGAADSFVLAGSGWITPFAAPAAYDFSGALSVPPIRAAASRPILVAGSLPFHIQGRGLKAGSTSATAWIELHPDASTPALLGPGRLAADINGGLVRWQVDLAAASGSVRAKGDIGFAKTPAFHVREGEVDSVRVALFAGDTTSCRLSAHFLAEGRIASPSSMIATAHVASRSLSYGAHEIRDGRATLRLERTRAQLDAKAMVDSANIEAMASVASLERPREAKLAMTFRDLDLARITEGKWPASRLAGSLRAQVAGSDLEDLLAASKRRAALDGAHGTVRLDLEPSTFRGQSVSALTLAGDLSGGTMRIGGRLESSSDAARLVGTITGRAAGVEDTDSLEADATLDLSGSRIRRLTFDRFVGRAHFSGGHLDAGLDLRAGSDSANVILGGEPFADPARLRASGGLRFDRLGELAGVDTLKSAARLSFTAEGELPRRGGLPELQLSGRLGGNANVGDAVLDTIAVEFDVKRGVIHVPRLMLGGNLIATHGGGSIALPGGAATESTSFAVEGTLGALDPLAPLLGLGSLSTLHGRFGLTAEGSAGATAFTARASLLRPHVNKIWADSMALQISGTIRDTTLTGLTSRVTAWSLVVWPLASRDLDAMIDWDGRELSAKIRSLIMGERKEEFVLRLEPRAGGVRGRLDRLMHDHSGGTITLERPVEFEVGKRLFLSDLVLLDGDRPLLRAHGSAEPSGAVGFEVHLDSLNLAYLGEFSGLSALRGTVSLDGSLSGTREQPILDAALRAWLIAGKRKPALLQGRLRWADGIFDLTAGFDQTPDNRAALTARLPLALTLEPTSGASPMTRAASSMRAHIEAHRIDLSWFEPLIPPGTARGLKGWVDGTVEAEGDPEFPTLSGHLALSEGRVAVPPLGVEFKDGEVSLGFADHTIRLERARLRSGGTLEANGTATLQGRGRRTVDLDVTLRRFVPMNTANAKADVTGWIAVSGNLEAPQVRGDLSLRKSTIYAEKGAATGLEPVELSRRDRLDLQERFGMEVGEKPRRKALLGDSTDVDVDVTIGDNVWVRRRSDPIVALELKGDIRARKSRGATLDASGTLGIRTGRSYLSFLGRRFEMLRADVDLPGPVDSASAHLEAFYRPRANESNSADVEVTAIVDIDASGVATTLRSEPYLDHSSLLNYLATGQVQGGTGSGTAYGLAVGTVLGAVGGSAGRGLGLDVVTVTMDAYGGQILSAGSYVNPSVYLGFRQPVVQGSTTGNSSTSGTATTEFEVEVEAWRNLLLNFHGSPARYWFIVRPRLGR